MAPGPQGKLSTLQGVPLLKTDPPTNANKRSKKKTSMLMLHLNPMNIKREALLKSPELIEQLIIGGNHDGDGVPNLSSLGAVAVDATQHSGHYII